MEPNAASLHVLARESSDVTVLLHAAIARQAGLSGTDHKYLGLLVQHCAMTAGEWGKMIGLSSGAVTGLIDRLEKKGLVKRTFDENDRRKLIIVPNTVRVQELFGGVFGDLHSQTSQFLATMTTAEIAAVESYLLATIAIMKNVMQHLPNQ